MSNIIFVASFQIRDYRFAQDEPTVSKSFSLFSTKKKAEEYVKKREQELESRERMISKIEEVTIDDHFEYSIADDY